MLRAESRGHNSPAAQTSVPCSPTHSPGSQEEAMPLESGTRVRRRSCAGGWEIWKREKRKKKKEVPCWGIEEGKLADINLSKGHYRKILKCGILACKDNYRGIIYDSEKKEY